MAEHFARIFPELSCQGELRGGWHLPPGLPTEKSRGVLRALEVCRFIGCHDVCHTRQNTLITSHEQGAPTLPSHCIPPRCACRHGALRRDTHWYSSTS